MQFSPEILSYIIFVALDCFFFSCVWKLYIWLKKHAMGDCSFTCNNFSPHHPLRDVFPFVISSYILWVCFFPWLLLILMADSHISVRLSVKCSCRHVFSRHTFYIYIDIIIYKQACAHIYTLSRLFQYVLLGPVPNELQLIFDVFSVWQVVSRLTRGKYSLMFEDCLLISELCRWTLSTQVVNLLCSPSWCWFFPYGRWHQDLFFEESVNEMYCWLSGMWETFWSTLCFISAEMLAGWQERLEDGDFSHGVLRVLEVY